MKSSRVNSDSNIVVRFFSSVKLAIFLFIILAITSIIGTVLPQGESLQFYLERYGPFYFKIIRTLQLYDTYHAWWYLSLLGLFSINLVVCTIKRLPYTLRLINKDSTELGRDELLRRPLKRHWVISAKSNPSEIKEQVVKTFKEMLGSVRHKRTDQGEELYLSERGKWNYWGVYLIHISILVIFAGAIYGSFTGFKGRLMLLEGESSAHVISMDSHGNVKKIPLGFEVKCKRFEVDFYPNGAPKLFKSDLAVIENNKEVMHKSILVNDPMTYKGITFYQASYQPVPEVKVKVVSPEGKEKVMVLSSFNRGVWREKNLLVGLIRYLPNVHGEPAARVFIGNINGNTGDALWLIKDHAKTCSINGQKYKLSLLDAQERYMTGLQVKKDPGVWLVWLGCAAMVLGFGIVFWIGHRRIWLWIGNRDGKLEVILAGQANKNKASFEKEFEKIEKALNEKIGDA